MSASFSDMSFLAGDTTFQARVLEALVQACINVGNEGWTVPFHRERSSFASQVMNAPSSFQTIFGQSVATDPTVISDATQNGTTVLTSANAAAQAALVTDAHITNAISAQFNTFFRTPA